MSTDRRSLEAAIAALEAQRALLGDAVVDLAIAPLREKLDSAGGEPEQRLKTASVLFADVVGSTDLASRLDPEEVHAVMDGALERLTEIVAAHGGRVLQYAGDGLLAVFGADESREDDPEQAVRAGLETLAAIPVLQKRYAAALGDVPFQLRVGISTGQVLLGGGVDGEGTVRGSTVNVAARMEQSAPPGALRISHDTYRHVRGVFECDAEAPVQVKGYAEPVRSHLVRGVRPRTFRVANRGLEGIETPLVGRDAELARLRDAYASAALDRECALVTVVGDAGLGKSRLLDEFARELQRGEPAPRVMRGRPQPYGNNVPYGLLRDLLASSFDILDGDPRDVARGKLARAIGSVLGERVAEQTALIGQLIGLDYQDDPHIAGIAGEARQLRDRAFHALASWFRALSTTGALVLLLDDLHWADEGSLDFVNRLADACADRPLLVCCLTRATLFERRPLWGSGQSRHERIALAPLNKRSSRELVEALLHRLAEVPNALRDLLTTSAEGNPYFVEELVGMLIDEGVIVTGGDPWRVVADKLLDVRVPPTLAGVLQARIDSLPAGERSALQQASVIGHVFWDEALQRIAPAAPSELPQLMRRELTFGRETSAFEGANEFVFKHHVLHQVTYDGVLKRQKREQHRQTADWLVVRSGDRASEYFGLIAEHYERAGDPVNAAHYLAKAAMDAARGYVNDAALDYLRRALALLPDGDPAARFELLYTRRGVLANLGRRAEQEADIVELEQLAERAADPALLARAAGVRASFSLVMGDYAGVAAAATRAIAAADAAGVRGAALVARVNWARALQFQGDYAAAQSHAEQSLALAREVGDRRLEGAMLGQLGILAFQLGCYGIARHHYSAALELARATGDRAVESGMVNNLADAERQLGNYDAAFELLHSGQRICREIGQRMTEAYMLCNLALVAFLRGDAGPALLLTGEALELARTLQDRDLRAAVLCTRGHAHASLGEDDEATACYVESAALYRELGRATMPHEPTAGLARLALRRQRLAEARGHVDTIVAHLDGGGTVDGVEDPLWIYVTLHEVLSAAGDARGDEFVRRAHALLQERAAPLGVEERSAFFERVPSHRAVVSAWERRRATAGDVSAGAATGA